MTKRKTIAHIKLKIESLGLIKISNTETIRIKVTKLINVPIINKLLFLNQV